MGYPDCRSGVLANTELFLIGLRHKRSAEVRNRPEADTFLSGLKILQAEFLLSPSAESGMVGEDGRH